MSARGEGRLYRENERRKWMMQYYAPGPDGKMRRVKESSGTLDVKLARKKLKDRIAKIRLARNTGEAIEMPVNRKITVAEVLEEYLKDLRIREVKGIRNEEFRLGKDSPLSIALGHYRVAALSRNILVEFQEERRKAGRSNATINHDLQGLRSALLLAERSGRIFRVPAFPAKLRSKVRTGFFSEEEVGKLIEAAVKANALWLAEMIRFAYATGWRRGELMGLRWEWVDSEAGEIRLPETKNGEGRVVPIAGELVEIMEHLETLRRFRPSEFVFHDNGRRITRKRFTHAWNASRKAAGLSQRLFHDFRRSAARRMNNAGVPQFVAMRVTGHKTASMYKRYSIVETADIARALDRVAGIDEKDQAKTR